MIRNKNQFQRLLSEKKSSITDKELFTSKYITNMFKSITDAIAKTFKTMFKVVLVWLDDDDQTTAYSELGSDSYRSIVMNVNNELVRDSNRLTRLKLLLGQLLHEIGHLLYTDCKIYNAYKNDVLRTRTMECAPYVTSRMQAMPSITEGVLNVQFEIMNDIEDGYVDDRQMKKYPGYGQYLKEKRLKQTTLMADHTLEAMREEGLSDIVIALNLLLSYAKFGFINVLDEEAASEDDVYNTFLTLLPTVNEAVNCDSYRQRLQYSEVVLESFWQFIEPDIPEEQPKASKHSSSSSSEESESSSEEESSSGSEGNSEENEGSASESSSGSKGSSEEENSSSSEESSQPSNGESEGSASSSEENGSEDESEEEGGNEEGSSEETSFSDDDVDEDLGNAPSQQSESSGSDEGEEENTPSRQQLSENELNQLLNQLTQSSSGDSDDAKKSMKSNVSAVSGTPFKVNGENEQRQASPQQPESELKNALNELAEEQANAENEAAIQSEGQEILNSMPKGDYHEGITPYWHRKEPIVPNDYDEVLKEANEIVMKLTKQFEKYIKDMEMGDLDTELYFGQRLYAPYRRDMKKFASPVLPEDRTRIAVMLLIDMSGSMYGINIQIARQAAIVLYQFCKKMKIDISIYGHGSEDEEDVQMVSYSEFNGFDRDDIIRVTGVCAENWCNRDGYAVRYCCEKLLKQPAEERFMIVISDGCPSVSGYGFYYNPNTEETSGSAKEDINDLLTKYGRKGIHFITAGISGDKERLEALWCKGLPKRLQAKYLDVQKMDEMPKQLIGILKKFLEK